MPEQKGSNGLSMQIMPTHLDYADDIYEDDDDYDSEMTTNTMTVAKQKSVLESRKKSSTTSAATETKLLQTDL